MFVHQIQISSNVIIPMSTTDFHDRLQKQYSIKIERRTIGG